MLCRSREKKSGKTTSARPLSAIAVRFRYQSVGCRSHPSFASYLVFVRIYTFHPNEEIAINNLAMDLCNKYNAMSQNITKLVASNEVAVQQVTEISVLLSYHATNEQTILKRETACL